MVTNDISNGALAIKGFENRAEGGRNQDHDPAKLNKVHEDHRLVKYFAVLKIVHFLSIFRRSASELEIEEDDIAQLIRGLPCTCW
jgi:hypothetical protein